MSILSRGLVISWMSALGLSAGACEAGEFLMQTTHAPRSAFCSDLSVEDVIGFWQVRAGRTGSCLVALNRLAEVSGYGLYIETCTIAALSSAASWRPVRSGLELHEKSGAIVARFQMVDVDLFWSSESGYRMERAPVS